jgi:DNA-directed RNA polymerase specialized sigma24 family protein
VDEESQLFAELYAPLRRFAAVVGPIEADPDDLLQEAVARVLRRRRLTDLDKPGAYLRRTIVNLASNYGGVWPTSEGAGSIRAAYPSDLNELQRLSPQERAVLHLLEVEGYRYCRDRGIDGL